MYVYVYVKRWPERLLKIKLEQKKTDFKIQFNK